MPDGAVVDLVGAHSRPVFAEPQRGSAVLRGREDQVPISVVHHTSDRALVALEEDGAHRGARRLASGAAPAMRLKGQRAATLAELALQSAAVVLRDVCGVQLRASDELAVGP